MVLIFEKETKSPPVSGSYKNNLNGHQIEEES